MKCVLVDLLIFLLFSASPIILVVCDYLLNLFPVVGLLQLYLFIEPIYLLLQLLDAQHFHLYLIFQSLVPGHKILILCHKLVLLALQIDQLIL